MSFPVVVIDREGEDEGSSSNTNKALEKFYLDKIAILQQRLLEADERLFELELQLNSLKGV